LLPEWVRPRERSAAVAYTRFHWAFSTLALLSLLAAGCSQRDAGWEPPLEETSTRVLRTEVDDALRLAREARHDVRSDPDQAAERLDDALRALQRLDEYYLPLVEARERTYNAHRFLYFGEKHRARDEIETVETILDGVAATGGGELQPALKEPLDLVSEAKAAVMATSENAPDLVKSLAIKLNFMALKGRLELPDDWPASR